MKTNEAKTLKDLMNENIFEADFKEEIIELPLKKIKPNPYQPRYVFDENQIKELSLSIKEHGVIQPIIVKDVNGSYVIIAGERRFRASKLAGLKTIPAVVRQYEKSKMIELALIENLQRENLSPIEEAKAYNQIMRELDLTQREVAIKVGKTRSYVTNMLGLLNLPDEVLSLVDSKKLSMGHARALSKLLDKDRIIELAKVIVSKNLSVRETEKLVQKEDKKVQIKKHIINIYKKEEASLSKKYNTSAHIANKKVTLTFKNEDELHDFLNKLLKED
ncbi:MAG: ParB/RepB/Spo0J family partition protein [Acholeplasmatales bacterium]|nr:ParB/RepB/Spo0J family partition protein [Acholeplasmatales bacterium]